LKVSIITAVFNSVETIEDCIRSIRSQTYPHIEHIIIDGGSTDGTLEILTKYKSKISRCISESDNGIYDAMNKGIMLATGEIIGILNSDDFYPDEFVIEKVVAALQSNSTDSCYGDVIYVHKDCPYKIVRYWKGIQFSRKKFKLGWMPHHGTFYAKKEVFEKYGVYRNDFRIAADYELMLRFLYKYGISTTYIPEVLLKVRTGGASSPSLRTTAKVIKENYKAWVVNDLNPLAVTFILKPLLKIPQYIKKP
jgi:glycosyltransferase involved in cell wall biosynthesis